MYLDNLWNPSQFQGHRSKANVSFFGVFLCASCCGYPRTVLSLEQGLIILLLFITIFYGQIYTIVHTGGNDGVHLESGSVAVNDDIKAEP